VALGDPEYIQELFSAFGPVSVRRMFGGAGIFADGRMIGLISRDEIYLKADQETAPAFEAEGMKPFTYGAKRRRVVMSYWRMPERLFDDPDELAQWARAAVGAAERSGRQRKKAAASRKSKKPVAARRKKVRVSRQAT
jgi:DNA transformation protein and related proteins